MSTVMIEMQCLKSIIRHICIHFKKQPGRKQAQLVVESKRYKDPEIRRLISMTTWSPEWQTYTFKVGDGAISTTTSFK